MFKFKIISSLENPFIDESIDKYPSLEKMSVLCGERFSVQLLYTCEHDENPFKRTRAIPKIEGKLANYAKFHNVENIPVSYPVQARGTGDDFLREQAGLYPDLLSPLTSNDSIYIIKYNLRSLWIEFNIPEECPELVGESDVTLTLTNKANGEELFRGSFRLDIIGAALPDQRLKVTQWMTHSSLSGYYSTPFGSEKYWEYLENYIRVATKNGINMQYAPIFSNPKTEELEEDPALLKYVTVRKHGEGYEFSWDCLDRWIDLCDRLGVKYLEFPHLILMGEGHPRLNNIKGLVDGSIKDLYGWNITAEECRGFLVPFFRELKEHLSARGDLERAHFHLCDEPSLERLPVYKMAKDWVNDIIGDHPVMDAIFDYEYYESGVVNTPVPITNKLKPFIERGAKNLWTYYCLGQHSGHSNRYLSMPSWRNRSIGMQLYKYDIKGFLHWGYNFYGNLECDSFINPYLEASAEGWVPAGDAFSVYPGKDGTALESLRLLVFNDAIEDTRAMHLAESLYDKKTVVDAMEKALGREIAFNVCARSSAEMLAVREAVNALIKAKIG